VDRQAVPDRRQGECWYFESDNKMAVKKKSPVFDIIKKIDKLKDGTGTVWQGERGVYIIRHVEKREKPHAPVAHVMLNSRYLSGLFRTKRKDVFSADIKTGAGKMYLLFLVHDQEGNIEIVQKNTPLQVQIT